MERITIPLFKVHMAPEVDAEVLKVLHSGYVGQGHKVEEFEKKIGKFVTNPRVLTVNSGTSALHLALHLIGVEGGEVITTPMTCTATVWPILANRADVVWADIDPKTGNMDPNSVADLITDRTRAILPVHWGGTPVDLQELKQVSQGIPLVEDAAHAFGAAYGSRRIGAISEYTCFSFQAIKHVTCVDGGALCVEDPEQYRRGKLIRWYGIDREQPRCDFRCEEKIPEWGYKFHMNDVAATIGMANLAHADHVLGLHAAHALKYWSSLKVPTVPYQMDRVSSWWLYTIFVEDRPGFMKRMTEKGIQVSRVHERVDKHPCVKQYKRELPGVDTFVKRMVCIPVGWWVTDEEIHYIIDTINEGW